MLERTVGSGREGGLVAGLLANIAAIVCLLLLSTGALAAPDLRIPAGYSVEQQGPVRWTYPTRAEAEVEQLKHRAQSAWPELSQALGAPLGEGLDIRVAKNPSEMARLAPQGIGLPGYASGVAFPARGLILLTLTAPGSWQRPNMSSVLVHELSHVALHRAVAGRPVPRWFSEGTAIHHAGENSVARIRTLWEGALAKRLLPLSRLNQGFSANHHGVDLAYAQSADVLRFLLESDGGEARFRQLIAALREGSHFDAAVEQTYGRSLERLENAWRTELSKRFGRWPLVLMSLTGVWVFGAVLLLLGYVRARRRHHATLKRWAIEEAPLAEEEVLPAPEPPPPANPDGKLLQRVRKPEPGVPTVEHDGRNHTLH